jgi:hypothetical protein
MENKLQIAFHLQFCKLIKQSDAVILVIRQKRLHTVYDKTV